MTFSFPWSSVKKVTRMLDKLVFWDMNENEIITLPIYCILKQKTGLFEGEERINFLTELVASAFNHVINDLNNSPGTIRIIRNNLFNSQKQGPTCKHQKSSYFNVDFRTLCPHCGSPEHEYYYSEEFFAREKKDKAKHCAEQIAGEVLSYIINGKPGPYSQYERKEPDEFKCLSCGHIFKK